MEEERKEEKNLEDLLRAHSSHFTSMAELIPAKFYVSKDPESAGGEDRVAAAESKYWVNKRQKKTPKEVIKKAKKLKLDPEARKSVAELQAEADCLEEDVGDKEKPPNGFSVDRVQSLSLGNLQSRLKEKIESLRRSRKAPPEGKEDGGGGGDMKEKVVVKRKKKKEKLKREKELKKRKLVSGGGGGDGAVKGSAGKGEERETEVKKRVTFSKFDFSLPVQAEDQERAVEGKTKNKSGGKRDYKKLLAKAEATQKKLDEIKRNDERRGRELEKRLQWQKALDMARGVKLRDDPRLLKKSLKRVEKKKQKSKKEWEARKESEREALEKRQEKRKRNIQARVDQVKARKIKKRMKKGTPRKPGF